MPGFAEWKVLSLTHPTKLTHLPMPHQAHQITKPRIHQVTKHTISPSSVRWNVVSSELITR